MGGSLQAVSEVQELEEQLREAKDHQADAAKAEKTARARVKELELEQASFASQVRIDGGR